MSLDSLSKIGLWGILLIASHSIHPESPLQYLCIVSLFTGDPVSHIGKLVIFSGSDGHVISFVLMPDNVESYYSPQVSLGDRLSQHSL